MLLNRTQAREGMVSREEWADHLLPWIKYQHQRGVALTNACQDGRMPGRYMMMLAVSVLAFLAGILVATVLV